MVLVCHPKKFIFLKTRKTAGTSFEMMLQPYCAPPGHVVREVTSESVSEYGVVGARMKSKGSVWVNHLAAHKVKTLLGDRKWNEYTRITSVRNPFLRAVSQFYWQIYWRRLTIGESIDEHRARFDDYIFSPFFKSDRSIVLVDEKFIIDDAFRMEHMEQDIRRISLKFGLGVTIRNLPKTKDNAHNKPKFDYRELFTPRIEKKIRRRQRWVFENFEYPESILK